MSTENETPLTDEVAEDILDFFTPDDLTPQLPDHEIETFSVAGGAKRKIAVRRLRGEDLLKALRDGGKSEEIKDRLALKLKRCVLLPNDLSKPFFTDVSVLSFIKTCDGETLLEMIAAVHRVNPLLKNA